MLRLLLVNRYLTQSCLVTTVLFLAACSPSTSPSEQEKRAATVPAPSAAQDQSASSAAPVPDVLAFTAPKLGGGQVVGSELVGRDLAIFFWAPW